MKIPQEKNGTVVLGRAGYVLNKVVPKSASKEQISPAVKILTQIYADAAAAYLQEFSDRANARIDRYEQLVSQAI